MSHEETAVTEKPKTMLQHHKSWIEDPEFQNQLVIAAGKGVDGAKFARNFMTVLQNNPKLAQCTQRTLMLGLLEAAGLGLSITSALGQAHLVPFKNRKAGTTEATLILGYQGLLDLAYRSDKILGIRAACVYQKEVFELEEGPTGQIFQHVPLWDKPVHKRGAFRGVYAIATLAGGHEKRIILSADEVNKVRKKDGPWAEYPDAMERKTAIRRLCKELPLTTEARESVNIDERRDLGIVEGIQATETTAEPTGGSAMDKFETEMGENPPEEPRKGTGKKSAKSKKPPKDVTPVEEAAPDDTVCAGCGTTENVGPNGLCNTCQESADAA